MATDMKGLPSVGKFEAYVERSIALDSNQLPERELDMISVDDHFVETGAHFENRVPKKYAEMAPRVESQADGDAWVIDGNVDLITAGEAHIGWQAGGSEERVHGAVRVADMLPGAVDIDARVHDMNVDGIWASVLFPSMGFGFAGQRISKIKDAAASLACVRAYNDWMLEEIVGRHPDRIIATQIINFLDANVAADDIRKNAERGFKAVHFSENPEKIGYPSIHTGYWDPFFRACEETGTVINLHLGSSSHRIFPSTDSPMKAIHGALTVNPILAAFDWVYSEIPLRFPELRIMLSEGGLDWVPMVIGRMQLHARNRDLGHWSSKEITPAEALTRNFYFSSLYDQSAFQFLSELCPDHIMLETDYPHGDSMWPESHEHFEAVLKGVDPKFFDAFYFRNAAKLYRHPIPPSKR